jgi:hypothetical protein
MCIKKIQEEERKLSMQLRGYYQKGKEKLKIEKTTYRKLPCPTQYCNNLHKLH